MEIGALEVMVDPVDPVDLDGGEVSRFMLQHSNRFNVDIPLGPSGAGPWGSSGPPWSGWSTRSDWRNGPWTAWWGGSACPPSDWPGWTAGPWSTNAPWTAWSGCTAKTTAASVVTRTVNGTAQVSTALGLQVAVASNVNLGGTTGAGERVTAGVGALLAAAVLGLAVGL